MFDWKGAVAALRNGSSVHQVGPKSMIVGPPGL